MKKRQTTETKRRTFLKTGTAAAAGMVGLRAESVFGAPANSAPGIGVVGCGDRCRYVGRFFDQLTEARILALADPFADRLQETKSFFEENSPLSYIQTFQGLDAYRDLLGTGVDGVVLTSPSYFHPEQAAAVVQAGKHLFMAKPVASDTAGCLSVAVTGRKAAERNLNFFVDFQTRSRPAFIEAAKRVHEDAIGRPVFGQVYYHTGRRRVRSTRGMPKDEARLRNWLYDIALSGDIIVEQHVHVLDVSDWYLCGHPVKAYGTGGVEARTGLGDCWDHFLVIYYYPNNVKIDFSSSQFLRGFHEMCVRVYGTKGTVDSYYNGPINITGTHPWEGAEKDMTYRDGAMTNVKTFVENIKTGKVTNNGEVSVQSTLTAILGRTAAYEGREVTWEEMINSNARFEVNLNL